MSETSGDDIGLKDAFANHGVDVLAVELRSFPQENHYIVYVAPDDLQQSLNIGNKLDAADSGRFVIVRAASEEMLRSIRFPEERGPIRSVHDERCSELINLVSARSRVSSAQPSLAYVPDARANLAAVTAARHHLIFGRRGAGKTALLVEAMRQVSEKGALSAWVNIQSLRRESPQRVVLYVLDRITNELLRSKLVSERSQIAISLSVLSARFKSLLDAERTEMEQVLELVPRTQRVLEDYLSIAGASLYVFIDDFYYLPRVAQPEVLDILHGCTRDTNTWLKVASIKHLTRWWQASPPVGLQSGQDADLIDLDITLQDPSAAKAFLEGVLVEFAKSVGIPALSRVFRADALDRLVLASGAVPRDYLVLATSSISRAQRRVNARLVGVQEVNQAAGDAAASKIQELEEDMASNSGTAEITLDTLKAVRNFCLDEKAFTYFLVAFRDREDNPAAYNLLTDLMDVRLIHMVDPAVSDAHSAGHRSEAFMLDLSQFSGARLKQKIRVLDFIGGQFVSRETRSSVPPRVASSTREWIAVLRTAPTLELSALPVPN